ncbi:MAG: hypothetical protein AAF357_08605, partial [Verrucomicrobiota bacterium]
MNTPEPTSIEREPAKPKSERYPFHIQGELFVPLESSLPCEICICSGKPAIGSYSKALRNIKSPLSWYLPRPTIQIGLSKKCSEARLVAHTLTYSLLALGLILVIVGIITFSVGTALIGLLAAALSGAFRARESIQGVDRGD